MIRSRLRLLASLVGLSAGLSATGSARGDDAIQACIDTADRGQSQRDAGKYRAAGGSFAKCSAPDCPPVIARQCTQWLEQIGVDAPTIVLGATDASGKDLPIVRVWIDGEPLVSGVDGRPVRMDSGEHVFRFQAPSGQVIEEHAVLRAGVRRAMTVRFGLTAPTSAPNEGPIRPVPASVWLGWGVGGVALGVFATFAVLGTSERSHVLGQSCASTRTCDPSDESGVRTKFLVADVALTIGIVSAAVATVLFLTRPGATSFGRYEPQAHP